MLQNLPPLSKAAAGKGADRGEKAKTVAESFAWPKIGARLTLHINHQFLLKPGITENSIDRKNLRIRKTIAG